VRARGPDDAYAITYTNFSVWNGTSWITDQDPSTPGGLVDVWPDPLGDVYAIQAYSNGGLYHRSSAGVWTLLAGSLDNAVRVWGSALNDIWIATNSGLEHWDGIGPGTTLCATCATRMWALSGTSASDVFAVGDSGSILHWNGAAWTAMTSNATGFLDDVFAVSASDVHVVGYNGVYLHYNGVAWTPSIVPPGSDLYGVWATSDHDVFVIGGNGMSHFDGARWSPVRTLGFGYAAGITGKGDVLYTIDNRALVTRLIRTIPW
jgi:hypothetical protein